jgi:hypothetical protein
MTGKFLEWQSSLAEILPKDFVHPGLRTVRFIFCDDQPNENGQGIEYADFAQLKQSAIGTPIKMKFLGTSVSGHHGSIPVGHIKSMTEREITANDKLVHQLIADGILYAEEYPDEVAYLDNAFAEGTSPGLSWELTHDAEKSIFKDGIEWLKGLLTRAATFVREPAYGNRTAILALASNKELSAAEFMEELTELVRTESATPSKKLEGGYNSMDEKEIEKLKADLANALAAIAAKDTELATKTEEYSTIVAENTALKTSAQEKDQVIAEFTNKERLTTRLAAIVEAGIPLETDTAKLEAKKKFYLDLSDEAFAEYVTDLKNIVASKSDFKVVASRRTSAFPKFDASGDTAPVSLADLGSRLKNLSRSPITTTE